jgi:hypothetical protein
MSDEGSPEIIRPMKLAGESVTEDPYDTDVSEAEQASFEEERAKSDAITSWY